MKKESTSTMSKYSPNMVPNGFIGPFPFPISTQKNKPYLKVLWHFYATNKPYFYPSQFLDLKWFQIL